MGEQRTALREMMSRANVFPLFLFPSLKNGPRVLHPITEDDDDDTYLTNTLRGIPSQQQRDADQLRTALSCPKTWPPLSEHTSQHQH